MSGNGERSTRDEAQAPLPGERGGPTGAQAAADVAVFVVASIAMYGVEAWLRSRGLFPLPGLLDGVMSLIAAFGVVVLLMRWRGQGWAAFGLRAPRRWWLIPAWAFAVLVVNIVVQNTVVPILGAALGAEPPDFSRYDAIRGNLPMLVMVGSGVMITGGFMEEVIYRGFVIDRFARIFGGGRRGLWLAALLNGLPFGIIHFEWGFGGILMTTVMGSVLGVMFLLAGRNLWPLVVAHATLDALLMTMLYAGAM